MAFQSSVMFWLVIKCDYFKSCPIDICFTEQGAQQLKQALSLPKDQKSLKWGSNRRKHQCCELTPSAWLVPNQKLSCYKSTHIPRVRKPQHHNSTGRAKYRWKRVWWLILKTGTPAPGDEIRTKTLRPLQYNINTKACLHIITAVPKQQHFSSFRALKLWVVVSSFSFPDTPEAHELLWAKIQEKQGYLPRHLHWAQREDWAAVRCLQTKNLLRKSEIHSLRTPRGAGFFSSVYKFMLCPTARERWPSCETQAES